MAGEEIHGEARAAQFRDRRNVAVPHREAPRLVRRIRIQHHHVQLVLAMETQGLRSHRECNQVGGRRVHRREPRGAPSKIAETEEVRNLLWIEADVLRDSVKEKLPISS
jgi:hypothetical protein